MKLDMVLTKKEAREYIDSLDFKPELQDVKQTIVKHFSDDAQGIIETKVLQSKLSNYVTSLEPVEKKTEDENKKDTVHAQNSQKLSEVQKEIDRLLAKPYSMSVENSLNFLRDKEKKLQKTFQ